MILHRLRFHNIVYQKKKKKKAIPLADVVEDVGAVEHL